jgi:hypothetical protein
MPFGFLSMVIFRLPLAFSQSFSFWRLMGCGKAGTFDIVPDLNQWGILLVHKNNDYDVLPEQLTPSPFINRYFKLFKGTVTRFLLEPIEGHGLWNKKEVFGKLPKQTAYEGKIAVLTRATIRLTKLKSFWQNVPAVSRQMKNTEGLIKSYGIGEVPLIKQATFSIWQSKAAMKSFAYAMQEHQQVIRKTHTQKWYSEEMFVRFKVLDQKTLSYTGANI